MENSAPFSLPIPIPVNDGGTGVTSFTPYALITGGTTSVGVLQQVSGLGNSGQVLTSTGAGQLPTWQTPPPSMAIGGSVTSGTAGSVLFVDAGGVLAQNNAKFFFDNTNIRLGIGTSSPSTTLHLATSTLGAAQLKIAYSVDYDILRARWQTGIGTILENDFAIGGMIYKSNSHTFKDENDASIFRPFNQSNCWSDAVMAGVTYLGVNGTNGIISGGANISTGRLALLNAFVQVTNTDIFSGVTPVPTALFEIINATAARIAFKINGAASQSAALIQLQGISSTSAVREQMEIDTAWATSTDATRKARAIFRVWDTAAREFMRGEASGSAAMIGFLGANAVVQQTGDIGTALVTFGLMSGTPTFAATNLIGTSGLFSTVVGNDRKTGLTAAQALATYTVGASDATFMISANILITSSTLHSFSVTCSYTDESNTARVLTLNFSQLTGAFVTTLTNALGASAYEGVPTHIRAKAGTTIIIASTGTFTTVTYNFEERIIQL